MLNNYRFLLYRPQNKTQLQLSFFFSFSKLSLFIWLFIEERIAKGSHRWLYLLQFGSYGGLKTNQRWNKRFSETFQSLYSLSWILKLLLFYMFHWGFWYVLIVSRHFARCSAAFFPFADCVRMTPEWNV